MALQSDCPAAERLIGLLSEIFAGLGGEAGRGLPELLRESASRNRGSTRTGSRSNRAILPCVCRFSSASRSNRVARDLNEDELASLRRESEAELAEPGRSGTTFTLIQSWGSVEGEG